MSLRTEFLGELNALAKRRDPDALIAKMRQVMVDRHPATLSPEEQDPVTTVALAWKEASAAGRQTFEAAVRKILPAMERARIEASPDECDWPLAHAVLRLLPMLDSSMISSAGRGAIVRTLSGTVSERQEMLAMLSGTYPEAGDLWTSAFRLYVFWHEQQPAWLETFWKLSLTDGNWPLNEGAFVMLEDAARRHPEFISMDRLVTFWSTANRRGAALADLRRWFYVIGASLEDSNEGRAILVNLDENFGGHFQDQRHESPKLPWDHFVEVMASAFRNPRRQEHILSFKTAAKVSASVLEHYRQIPKDFKAPAASVNTSLLSTLLTSLPATAPA